MGETNAVTTRLPPDTPRSEDRYSFQVVLAAVAYRSLSSGFRSDLAQASGADHGIPSALQLVTEHQIQMFVDRFPCWIATLFIISCITAMVEIGLMIWLIVSYLGEREKTCDTPLGIFALGELIGAGYSLIHIPILQCVMWFWCGRSPNAEYTLPVPARIYTLVIFSFDWAWVIFGLACVAQSSTCQDTAPQLYKASATYACFSMVNFIVVAINAVGLYTILNFMLRRGLLTSENSAPPGTLNKLRLVTFDTKSQLFMDSTECCICLGSFSASEADGEIRMTNCEHVFHGRCLGNWLRMNRACPLCRQDVTVELDTQAWPRPEAVGRSIEEGNTTSQDISTE